MDLLSLFFRAPLVHVVFPSSRLPVPMLQHGEMFRIDELQDQQQSRGEPKNIGGAFAYCMLHFLVPLLQLYS